MKKKMICLAILILLATVFPLIPFPASDLYIRIYFMEITGDSCVLYYSTDDSGSFSPKQYIVSEIDYSDRHVTFRLDSSLAGRITGLRLDFPDEQQLLSISSVTVSSAGVVKKQYHPCDFFREENYIPSEGIEAISLVKPLARAYFATFSTDPYLILSPELTGQLTACYSHFRLTRLLVCLFPLGCCLMSWKKIFTAD